jgi:colanic acid biosynthesis glycosyl transferase WcaI
VQNAGDATANYKLDAGIRQSHKHFLKVIFHSQRFVRSLILIYHFCHLDSTSDLVKLLILNQYAPPAQAPTSRLVDELRAFLVHQGHTVRIVSEQAEYRGHHARTGSRLLRELKALAVITWGALWSKPRPDVVLALSSPPCLLAAAALVASIRRIVLAHWAMDLYPDLAIALGELPTGASGIFRTLMRWAYRRCAIIVALDDDMAAHLKKVYGVETKIISPWAAADLTPKVIPPPTQGTGAALAAQSRTWLYSGNLGRAHEWRTILLAQRELEDRALPIQLLFEGGGAMWMDAQRFASELKLKNCRWCDYADEAQSLQTVLASSVVIATQRREARGLLWPSKLARIIPMRKPLIWIGPTDGAIANGIRDRPDTACFEPEQIQEIVAWIAASYKTPQTFANLDSAARTWERQRVERCNQWELLLKNLASSRANTGPQ